MTTADADYITCAECYYKRPSHPSKPQLAPGEFYCDARELVIHQDDKACGKFVDHDRAVRRFKRQL